MRKINKISKGVNPEIFRAYDIRGVYPSEINEKAAYKIGQAFVKFLNVKGLRPQVEGGVYGSGKPSPNIVIGRDNRLSSTSLFRSLINGIIKEKGNVIVLDLATTPMLYWATAYYGYDGGIEVSASHNPPQYNGFKLVREKAVPVGEKTGLKKIRELALKNFNKTARVATDKFFPISAGKKIIQKDILKDYLEFNLRDFNVQNFKPLNLVIDTANAVPGILLPYLKKKIPVKISPLFLKLDGHFPNHNPDPLIGKNLLSLQKEVRRRKADLGAAFDGDGDRIIFIDEKGEIIPGDLICALLAKIILEENPGKKILFDIRSSNIVRETIKREGGTPIVSRIGHTLIKEKMRKEDIFFAGEFSGHYYSKEHYFCEAPIFVLLKILETLSKTKKKLSELTAPFKKYFHSGEINFRAEEKSKILKTLERNYKNGKMCLVDGLRVDFKNWWFLVRPSNTEPVLRLVLEAKTKKLFEEKKKELISLIESFTL